MKKIITILVFFSTLFSFGQIKVGDKVPQYIFNDVINGDRKAFDISQQNKPLILEFWATWCSACIPAMKKLEAIQNKYEDQLEILTVSTDKLTSLNRYIKNTNTTLKIAFDTLHTDIFSYRYIPHTVLIDKEGYVRAITTPEYLTDEVISDFVQGKEINIVVTEEMPNNFNLNKEFKNNSYQYILTSENKNVSFKNEIKRNENKEPISLEFNNASIYRLLTDIYELSSSARIYTETEELLTGKYCFHLEQSDSYQKSLLVNAKEILNENSGVKAKLVEKTLDSVVVLEIYDSTKLPKVSNTEIFNYQFGGGYYKGTQISIKHLTAYLENEIMRPVKDKTGLDYIFDLELNCNYEDPRSLVEELKKNGFIIRRSKIPETITVLELSKP